MTCYRPLPQMSTNDPGANTSVDNNSIHSSRHQYPPLRASSVGHCEEWYWSHDAGGKILHTAKKSTALYKTEIRNLPLRVLKWYLDFEMGNAEMREFIQCARTYYDGLANKLDLYCGEIVIPFVDDKYSGYTLDECDDCQYLESILDQEDYRKNDPLLCDAIRIWLNEGLDSESDEEHSKPNDTEMETEEDHVLKEEESSIVESVPSEQSFSSGIPDNSIHMPIEPLGDEVHDHINGSPLTANVSRLGAKDDRNLNRGEQSENTINRPILSIPPNRIYNNIS
ncbi:hypothetical protein M422DRAFT_25526 [Sphaerobolus stellatus SS14]|nr:hypothetical protein M422DRAFT_25526 [Sphaerobolus stellatus SS14]